LAWNVFGQSNYGTQGMAATTVASGVTNSLGLTRGSGVTTTGTAATNAWGGRNWANTSSAGISGNQLASFGFTVSSGELASLATINMNYRRATGGPSNGYWQYQINNGSWTLIGDFTNEFSSTSTSGAAMAQISLSGISALQNITAGTVVRIRVVPYGATSSTATWYVYDINNSNDLALGGTVSALASTTTAITSNTPNPSSPTQAVVVNISVSGGVPNGENVTLKDASNGNAVLGTGALSSGATTITVAAGALSVGTHNIFAVYSGDSSFAGSQSPNVTQTVVANTSSTTITSDLPNPATRTQAIVFNVSVSGGVPNGEAVLLKDASNGNAQVGPAGILSSGATSITVPAGALSVGTHNIFAVYSGDANFSSSQSSTVSQSIILQPTTMTFVDNGPNPSAPNQTFTVTVTISPAVPDGEVVLVEDATTNNIVTGSTFTNGTCTLSIDSLNVGPHMLFSVYHGDSNYAASNSNQVSHSVLTPTTTTVTDNGPNPSTSGQAFDMTVTVSPAVPNGESVQIEDASNGNAVVGTGSLTAGSADVSVTLNSVGTHNLFAVYGGDSTDAASQSSQTAHMVTIAPTTTTLIDNGPSPSTSGQAVSFTATVSGGPAISGETVYIEDASNANAVVASPTLTNGTVTFTISNLTVGTHQLFAVYNGDSMHSASNSSSSPVTQIVNSGGGPAPAVSSIVVNGGDPQYTDSNGVSVSLAGQNSVVEQLLVTFNEPVTLDAGAFTIVNNAAGVTVNGGLAPNTQPVNANQTPVGGGSSATQWIVTFSGAGTIPLSFGGVGAVIKDGLYILHTDATKVHANSQTMAANNDTGFWAMYGSVYDDVVSSNIGDGNSEVFLDANDFNEFRTWLNNPGIDSTSPSYAATYFKYDYDLDGFIDADTFNTFRANLNNDWTF
jgi:hypothetical protein